MNARETILTKALALTDLIELTANGVMELALGIEDAKASLGFVEANLIQEITAQVDDKGKALFSNEASRSAELVIQKRSNALIKEGNELIARSTVNKNKLQNELEKYRNQLGIYKAFLYGSSVEGAAVHVVGGAA